MTGSLFIMAIRKLFIHPDPDSEELVEIVLRSALVADGLQKKILAQIGINETAKGTPERDLQAEYYPVCVSCVESPQSIREMSFKTFSNLLEVDTDAWYKKALELNRHWDFSLVPDEGRKWDVEDWLSAAYDNPEAEEGLMPSFEEKVFVFGSMSDELIVQAQKILTMLELTKFRWTINDCLVQPEELVDKVFYMKSIGEKMYVQAQKRKNANPKGS